MSKNESKHRDWFFNHTYSWRNKIHKKSSTCTVKDFIENDVNMICHSISKQTNSSKLWIINSIFSCYIPYYSFDFIDKRKINEMIVKCRTMFDNSTESNTHYNDYTSFSLEILPLFTQHWYISVLVKLIRDHLMCATNLIAFNWTDCREIFNMINERSEHVHTFIYNDSTILMKILSFVFVNSFVHFGSFDCQALLGCQKYFSYCDVSFSTTFSFDDFRIFLLCLQNNIFKSIYWFSNHISSINLYFWFGRLSLYCYERMRCRNKGQKIIN